MDLCLIVYMKNRAFRTGRYGGIGVIHMEQQNPCTGRIALPVLFSLSVQAFIFPYSCVSFVFHGSQSSHLLPVAVLEALFLFRFGVEKITTAALPEGHIQVAVFGFGRALFNL